MSENEKNDPESEVEDDAVTDNADSEPTPETQTDSPPEPPSEPEAAPEPRSAKPRRMPGGVAWLALLAAVLALAGVAYTMFEDWRSARGADQGASALAEVRSQIAGVNDALSRLDEALADLESTDAGVAGQLEFLQQDIDNRLQLLDSLPPRMSNMESAVAMLQGASAGARNNWLLAEAEYYMQIANAQLQLAGNPDLAALALRMADERIVQLADPAFTGVRRALADELAALDGMEKPDIEGITLMLASLARVVEGLPLLQVVAASADDEPVDPELSGVDRAWASVKGAVSGLVRITGPDQGAMPLLTPEAEYFLRTNLTLQLQAARLALLRGEQAVFAQSLEDASAWLEEYFDAESAPVSSALQTINEIRGGMVAVSKPDISGSLRLLRQAKTLAEPAQ